MIAQDGPYVEENYDYDETSENSMVDMSEGQSRNIRLTSLRSSSLRESSITF